MTTLVRPSLRTLERDDLEWFLDYSRRRYLVRPSIPAECKSREAITVIRLRDGKRLILWPTCLHCPEPWINTDAYAERRWSVVNEARRRRGEPEL